MSQNKIHVSNIPFNFTEDDLKTMFSEFGDIEEIKLITDRQTGHSRGFAFLTFATQFGAETALKKNGSDINGRKMSVSMAKEREPRRPNRRFRR